MPCGFISTFFFFWWSSQNNFAMLVLIFIFVQVHLFLLSTGSGEEHLLIHILLNICSTTLMSRYSATILYSQCTCWKVVILKMEILCWKDLYASISFHYLDNFGALRLASFQYWYSTLEQPCLMSDLNAGGPVINMLIRVLLGSRKANSMSYVEVCSGPPSILKHNE